MPNATCDESWTTHRALLYGCLAGLLLGLLNVELTSRSSAIPPAVFVPLCVALFGGFPIILIAMSFRRIRKLALGASYCAGGSLGFSSAWIGSQIPSLLSENDVSAPTFAQGAALLLTVVLSVWFCCWGLVRAAVRIRQQLTRIPQEHPFCASCGYDLFGITCGRCPECGAPTATPDQKHGKLMADR